MDWSRNLIRAFQLIAPFLNATLELMVRGLLVLVNTRTDVEMPKGSPGDKAFDSVGVPFPCRHRAAIVLWVPNRNFHLDGHQGWGVRHG